MNYDIVELEEKTVAAISARTNNTSPDMGAVCGPWSCHGLLPVSLKITRTMIWKMQKSICISH